MEQVESSWTGERPSPAPGENMAAPFKLAKEASRRCSLVLVSPIIKGLLSKSVFSQQLFQKNCINCQSGKKFFVKKKEYLDDKYVKVVNAFDVVTGADFGDQLRIQEPGHNTCS